MPKKEVNEDCPVGATLGVLSGKWKLLILFSLSQSVKRFSELRREIPDITQRMLTNQLRDLEARHIIHREVYPCVPPKVEYSLTPIGKTLLPLLDELKSWGVSYIMQIKKHK